MRARDWKSQLGRWEEGWVCIVCGFPALPQPALGESTGGWTAEYCPSCGYEHGYHEDAGQCYSSWRDAWVLTGMPWRLPSVEAEDSASSYAALRTPPAWWAPDKHLARLFGDELVPEVVLRSSVLHAALESLPTEGESLALLEVVHGAPRRCLTAAIDALCLPAFGPNMHDVDPTVRRLRREAAKALIRIQQGIGRVRTIR
jgi:hypothetical protein